MTIQSAPRHTGGLKQDFRPGDRVKTPLGHGVVLSLVTLERPEGTIRCRIKHWDYKDHDGDTFDLDTTGLFHLPDE